MSNKAKIVFELLILLMVVSFAVLIFSILGADRVFNYVFNVKKVDPHSLIRSNDSLYADSASSINNKIDSLIKNRDRYLSLILSDSLKKSVSETSINIQDSLFKSYGYSMDRNKKLVLDTLTTREGHMIILNHYNNQCLCSYIHDYELVIMDNEVVYEYEEETVPLKKNVDNSATFLED